jgi:hypothetical protein
VLGRARPRDFNITGFATKNLLPKLAAGSG